MLSTFSIDLSIIFGMWKADGESYSDRNGSSCAQKFTVINPFGRLLDCNRQTELSCARLL